MDIKKVKPQFIRDKSGKKSYVILPVDEYNELLEDFYDLAIIAERKDEPTISFEEFEKKLKADGLL